MATIETLPAHLNTLSPTDWEKLFSLLPEIAATKEFGWFKGGEKREDGTVTFPYQVQAEIVNKTVKAITSLDIMPVFDWMKWAEGIQMLNDENYDYSKQDAVTLCKLFTVAIRGDRFNEGFLVDIFQQGVMSEIIRALQKRVQEQ
ncbi:DUF6508 domain-containing protein [Chitinophaga sp. 212800010-3]|uniref:DUF6508 domain-containing protein n=1 Tax=unclassified Chitinophaga TaxID=2619133 RepID=UPI002DE2139A|nr:hypothetical protein [Chitinophaga sp. 212800010-3]